MRFIQRLSPFFTILIISSFLLLSGCLGPPAGPSPAPVLNTTLPPPVYSPPTPLTAPPTFNLSLQMTFLNVGFGDATLIRSGPLVVLFDTGPADTAPALITHLRGLGIEQIDVLILSSNNPLYVGAAPAILRQFNVGTLWTGANYSDNLSRAIAMAAQAVPKQTMRYGYRQTWGNFTLTALNPADPLEGSPDSDSVVLKATDGSFCALLFSSSVASGAMGGSEGGSVAGGVDARIATGSIPIQCPVMKVSAHASGNAASFELLQKVQPQIGIISVGPNPPQNAYPEPTTLRRLALQNVSVYITDKLGDITVTSNGSGYNISSQIPANATYWQFINNISNGQPYWPN